MIRLRTPPILIFDLSPCLKDPSQTANLQRHLNLFFSGIPPEDKNLFQKEVLSYIFLASFAENQFDTITLKLVSNPNSKLSVEFGQKNYPLLKAADLAEKNIPLFQSEQVNAFLKELAKLDIEKLYKDKGLTAALQISYLKILQMAREGTPEAQDAILIELNTILTVIGRTPGSIIRDQIISELDLPANLPSVDIRLCSQPASSLVLLIRALSPEAHIVLWREIIMPLTTFLEAIGWKLSLENPSPDTTARLLIATPVMLCLY